MSQPWQPPSPPQPQPYAAPHPWPGHGYGYPPPPPPPRPAGRPGAAFVLTLAVAVGAFLVHGFLTGLVVDLDELVEEAYRNGDSEIEVAQLSWLAPALGAAVGLPAAQLARGRAEMYWCAAVAAFGAMLLGETFATAVLAAEGSNGAKSAFELFFEEFSDLFEAWAENANGGTWPLMALAPAAALFTCYRLGGRERH